MVRRRQKRRHGTVAETERLEHFLTVLLCHHRSFGFELHRQRHDLGTGEFLAHRSSDRCFVADLILTNVEHGHDRLVGEEEELLEIAACVVVEASSVERRPLPQRVDDLVEQVDRALQRGVALEHALGLVPSLFGTCEIGERQFDLDHPQVLEGILRPRDVVVAERPQDEHDRVDLANVAEEGVAESFALARTFDEPADVGELHGGVNRLLALRHLAEGVEAVVGHLGDTDIGVGRGEGIGRCVGAASGKRVVQRGLARVGETDEPETFHSSDEATDLAASTVTDVTDVHATPSTEAAVSTTDAEHAFSRSILVSAVRCTFTYLLIPFGFPLIGLSAGVGPWIGLPVGLVAIAANLVSIRRFHRADHRWKWPMTAINLGIIVLLTVLVVLDTVELLG